MLLDRLGRLSAPKTKIKRGVEANAIGRCRLFAMIMAITVGCFLLGWQGLHIIDSRAQAESDRIAAVALVDQARRKVQEFVVTSASDLRIVARGRALHALAAGDDSAQEGVTEDFVNVVNEKPAIAQLRFLSSTGQEIVRVDRTGSAIFVLEGDELQNKSDRYYFQHAITLPEGGLYMSALDLNVEHGEIEVPWRPMLRLAAVVSAPSGESLGVVVMNLNADGLITDIERTRIPGVGEVELLNQDGYWLTGVPPDRLWGFMLGNETTLAKTDPGLWAEIEQTPSGIFSFQDQLFVTSTLRPETVLQKEQGNSRVRSDEEAWTILKRVPPPLPFWTVAEWPRFLLGILACVVISYVCARAIHARRRAETEKSRTEQELVRVERMASLGNLVAGIAHELNTPLGNALTVTTTLSERVDTLSEGIAAGRIGRSALEGLLRDIREGTAMLVSGLERAAEIVRHFKQVAVDQTSDRRRSFQLNEFVKDVTSTLGPQFKGTEVVLETELGSTSVVDSYPGALAQIITNLVGNALLHGFSEGGPGRVTVRTKDAAANQVVVEVSDTGKGVSPEVLERMFDPFFTTRMGSGGTGLGLSIVYNIVTGVLGGDINATSTPGSGTTITVSLPKAAPNPGAETQEREYYAPRTVRRAG